MRLLLPFWICSFFLVNVQAQQATTYWYFGNRAGLLFSDSNVTPQALDNSAMDRGEGGSVTISDKHTGKLLFYSNGETVWNYEHQVMPNGAALAGSSWVTQSSLIVPVPEEESLYYLFTLQQEERKPYAPISLYYSIVDMQLDNGRGDIVVDTKNSLLSEGVTEKLTAILHRDQNAYWLLTHEVGNNTFNFHFIDNTGISDVQKQSIGSVHPVRKVLAGGGGYMKASPDGTKLACAIGVTSGGVDDIFEMFDFNTRNGRLSNYLHLGDFASAYGVSFSPNNSKLYLTGWFPEGTSTNGPTFIHQYDLNATDIPASRVGFSAQDFYLIGNGSLNASSALQLASNGRIYYISDNYDTNQNRRTNYLYSIDFPNRKGLEAGISFTSIDYGESNYFVLGLPNFMQHYFQEERIRAPGQPEGSDPCDPQFAVQLFPNPSETEINVTVRERCFTPYTLRIITSTGQVLDNFATVNETSAILSVQSLATGMYLAELRFDDRVVSKKFIVR